MINFPFAYNKGVYNPIVNLISNGDFSVDTAGWNPYRNGGDNTPPNLSVINGELNIDCSADNIWTGASQTGLETEAEADYEFSFDVYGSHNVVNGISYYFGIDGNPQENRDISTTKTKQTFNFTATSSQSGRTIYIRTAKDQDLDWVRVDNVVLRKL